VHPRDYPRFLQVTGSPVGSPERPLIRHLTDEGCGAAGRCGESFVGAATNLSFAILQEHPDAASFLLSNFARPT